MGISKSHAPHIAIGIEDDDTTYYALTNEGVVLDTDTNIVTLLNTIQSSLSNGSVVEFQTGTYNGAGTYVNDSKRRVKYIGNQSTITGAKFQIGKTSSTSYSDAMQCVIDGLFFNGSGTGVVLDNNFMTEINNTNFVNCDEGLSIESSGAWSEFTTIRHTHFENCKKGLIFKTPTGTGSGSYVNSFLDVVNFNAGTGWDPGEATYTFIEVQDDAIVDEGRWLNMRLWFSTAEASGIGIDHSGSATRCQLFKPLFENFGTATNTIGIRINSEATSSFFLMGRPTFIGAGTWTGKFINSSNKYIHSSLSSWRTTTAITPGISSSFGSSSTILDGSAIGDPVGIPNIYIVTSGLEAGELITVEITATRYGAATSTVTKILQGNGTWPLSTSDYMTLSSNATVYILDTITARAHTNKSNITGLSVSVGAMQGGTLLPSPSAEPFIARISSDLMFSGYRPFANVASGCGMYLNMNNAGGGEENYARIYALIDTNSVGSHAGRFSFQLANSGTVAERFGVEKDGALNTKSYIDFTKISAPANPGTEVGRLYFKTKDGSNNGLYVKLKIGGSIVEKEIAFV